MGEAEGASTRPKLTMGDDGLLHAYHRKAMGAEAENFDFATDRNEKHPNTVLEGSGNLVKSCLGGGITAIHVAYMEVGLWIALILNFFLGIFVSYMMILARSAQRIYGRVKVSKMSYPDLAEATCDITSIKPIRRNSRILRYLVDMTIMIDLFGSCCCYQVLIGNQVQQIILQFGGPELSIRLIIFFLWIPCLALCMILHLKYLAWCSIAADVIIVAVAILTAVYGVQNAKAEGRDLSHMVFYKQDIGGLFQFIGICVFSMEGVGVTLPIENSLKEPKKIAAVLWLGMSAVVGIVMAVGFFGYWGFGENCKSPITYNFPFTWLATILKVGLPVMIYVTFALNFWVPFNLVWAYYREKYANNRPECAERVYRAVIVTIITAISVAFPAVNDLMGLIGSFCLSNMGFMYPATIELLLDYEEPGLGVFKWRLVRWLGIMLFGIMLLFVGTYSNVVAMIKTLQNLK